MDSDIEAFGSNKRRILREQCNRFSTAKGDMFVQATVETPINLSRAQKALLREFAE